MKIGRLHVLTDFHFQQRMSHGQLAARALAGGADMIQFREKHAGIRHALVSAAEVVTICRERGVPLIINDRLDLAQAIGADGVHLGQEDLRVRAARSVAGQGFIIGATAATLEQALRCQDEGADYVGFGPVFRTSSKDNPQAVQGLDTLASVCAAVSIPVIGIAGITPERVASVIRAGAHGVAVLSSVALASDPAAATRLFQDEIERALG